MLISKIIEELQRIQSEQGDIEAVIFQQGDIIYPDSFVKINSVKPIEVEQGYDRYTHSFSNNEYQEKGLHQQAIEKGVKISTDKTPESKTVVIFEV